MNFSLAEILSLKTHGYPKLGLDHTLVLRAESQDVGI